MNVNMRLLTALGELTKEDCGLTVPIDETSSAAERSLKIIEAAVTFGWMDVDINWLRADVPHLLSLDATTSDIEDLLIIKDESVNWMNEFSPRGFQFQDTPKGLVLIRYLALQEASHDEFEV